MKKFIILTLMLATFFSHAQNKSYIEVAGGYSIPMGDFAVRGYEKEYGDADHGFSYLLRYKYEFPSKLGLTATLYGQHIVLDYKYLKESLNSLLGYSQLYKVTSYNSMGLMVGPYFTKYISNNSFFTATALLGGSYNQSPQLKMRAWYGLNHSSVIDIEAESDTSIAFSYSLQGSFGYDLTPKLSALATLNYFATTPCFKISVFGNGNKVKEETNMKIKTINLMLGLQYQL